MPEAETFSPPYLPEAETSSGPYLRPAPAHIRCGSFEDRENAASCSHNREFFRDADGDEPETRYGIEQITALDPTIEAITNGEYEVSDEDECDADARLMPGYHHSDAAPEMDAEIFEAMELAELMQGKSIEDFEVDAMEAGADANVARRRARNTPTYEVVGNKGSRKWRHPDSAGKHGRHQFDERDHFFGSSCDPEFKNDPERANTSRRSPQPRAEEKLLKELPRSSLKMLAGIAVLQASPARKTHNMPSIIPRGDGHLFVF